MNIFPKFSNLWFSQKLKFSDCFTFMSMTVDACCTESLPYPKKQKTQQIFIGENTKPAVRIQQNWILHCIACSLKTFFFNTMKSKFHMNIVLNNKMKKAKELEVNLYFLWQVSSLNLLSDLAPTCYSHVEVWKLYTLRDFWFYRRLWWIKTIGGTLEVLHREKLLCKDECTLSTF